MILLNNYELYFVYGGIGPVNRVSNTKFHHRDCSSAIDAMVEQAKQYCSGPKAGGFHSAHFECFPDTFEQIVWGYYYCNVGVADGCVVM